jgi:preprotein translocase subunit Sec61beta
MDNQDPDFVVYLGCAFVAGFILAMGIFIHAGC